MELKIKYHYTYFIKPFYIGQIKYKNYLLQLLNSKCFNTKLFEKERDLNLYLYFTKEARNYFFPSFEFTNKDFEEMNNEQKAKFLSKYHCNMFSYNLKQVAQGKINKQDSDEIFFNIDKVDIICFDSGICFLVLKTNIENTESFSDLLNFNYKFKDINSDYKILKDYNNIKIQTSAFDSMTDLSEFIDNITGINTTKNDVDIFNKRFFVYTYSSIDQQYWKNDDDFKELENDFIKYTNVLSSNNTLNFNSQDFQDNYQEYKEFKYARFGFTKQSASLFTSNIDINNYTKILFDFENEYLYTLLISLYQRIFLKKLVEGYNPQKKYTIKMFYKYTKELWYSEITNSVTGTMYYNKWKEIFEIKKLYNEVKNKYEIAYRELGIDNNSKTNKIVAIALIVSLLLNVINFIIVAKLM